VAKDAEDLKVKTLTGAVIPAKVLHICEDADLALLELTLDAKLDPVKFFTGKVRVGMPVYALGSPSGDEGIVTAGIVSKVAGTAWNQEVDQGDFAATFGSSGGPVVLQDTGEVVGIVVGGRTSSGQILFIPVRIMRAWALKIGLKDAIE
jgi:serine protease Do